MDLTVRCPPANNWQLYPAMYARKDYPSPADDIHGLAFPPQFDSTVGPVRTSRFRTKHTVGRTRERSNSPIGQSPTTYSPYQPDTPASLAFSPYDDARRSRARSGSLYEPPSHSPAASDTPSPTHRVPERDATTAATQQKPKRKRRLRDYDRKKICEHADANKNARQEDIAMAFGVERSTISKILKERDRYLRMDVHPDVDDHSAKHRPSKFPEIESKMLEHLATWSGEARAITDALIKSTALEVAKEFNIALDKFKGSSGWVENFKNRNNIKRGEWLASPTHRQNQQHHHETIPAYDQFPPYNDWRDMDPALGHPGSMEYADQHTRAPTLQEAQTALDLVLAYLEMRDRDMRLVQVPERQFLRLMKGLFYQVSTGSPVDRSKIII